MVSSKYVKYFKNKKILITGGTGLIGMPLAQMLLIKINCHHCVSR